MHNYTDHPILGAIVLQRSIFGERLAEVFGKN